MNELITIPSQPTERCKFKRRQKVLFIGTNILRPCSAVVVEHYDFQDAVRVLDSQGERIVTVNELVSDAEYKVQKKAFLDAREEAEREELRLKLKPVIDLWNAGCRTAKEMAEKTGEKPIKFYSQITAIRQRGFVE